MTNAYVCLPSSATAAEVAARVQLLTAAYLYLDSPEPEVIELMRSRRERLVDLVTADPAIPTPPAADPTEAAERLLSAATFTADEFSKLEQLLATGPKSAERHYLLACGALRAWGIPALGEGQRWSTEITAAIQEDPTNPIYLELFDAVIAEAMSNNNAERQRLEAERLRLRRLLGM